MSSFDDKVYDFIKSFYPVGSRIRLGNGISVPSIGTWELVGIYGRHTYEDDNNLHHWVDFLGESIIDNVRSKDVIASEVSWDYDDLLGESNYAISTPFGTYLNESSDISSSTYTSEFNLNNGTTTYTGNLTSSKMTISNTDGKGINCAVNVLISDVSKVSLSDSKLCFEYQKTA